MNKYFGYNNEAVAKSYVLQQPLSFFVFFLSRRSRSEAGSGKKAVLGALENFAENVVKNSRSTTEYHLKDFRYASMALLDYGSHSNIFTGRSNGSAKSFSHCPIFVMMKILSGISSFAVSVKNRILEFAAWRFPVSRNNRCGREPAGT